MKIAIVTGASSGIGKEFVMQLARQNGVNEQNMAQLMQMFGKQ